MKKIVLSIVGILLCATMGFAQGVKFETGTWSDMLAKAKAENKLIFVDVYTQWCGPCKKVAKEVFPQKEVGDTYNNKFINYQIDAESEEGKKFVEKYPIGGYPSFFFIDGEGKVRHKFLGARDMQGFIQEAGMVETYAQYGGIDRMMAAIQDGTATREMLYDYYRFANDEEKPKALNAYLKALPAEELMDPDNELLDEISLYDKDLMMRLIDEIVKVGNREKWVSENKFIIEFDFKIGFPMQYRMSQYLEESIEKGDWAWFEELMELKERFMAYKSSKYDGDWNVQRGRGLFFATPEYCELSFMSYNRVEEEKFKTEFVDFMDKLMTETPVDSLLKKVETSPTMKILKEVSKDNGGAVTLWGQKLFKKGDMTAKNIIDWTDYFWKISPSTKAIKAQCYQYINYAYYANPYNINVAIKAADLLARIGNFKDAEEVLETAIQVHKELKQDDPKLFRPLEFKLRDIQNGKL